MEQFRIHLEGIELYGHHGLYPGEKELGAKYKIEVSFVVEVPDKDQYTLDDLVDYKKAYDGIKEIFQTPTPILENLVRTMAKKLKTLFPVANSVSITVSKLSPPLGGICQAAKVEYTLGK